MSLDLLLKYAEYTDYTQQYQESDDIVGILVKISQSSFDKMQSGGMPNLNLFNNIHNTALGKSMGFTQRPGDGYFGNKVAPLAFPKRDPNETDEEFNLKIQSFYNSPEFRNYINSIRNIYNKQMIDLQQQYPLKDLNGNPVHNQGLEQYQINSLPINQQYGVFNNTPYSQSPYVNMSMTPQMPYPDMR